MRSQTHPARRTMLQNHWLFALQDSTFLFRLSSSYELNQAQDLCNTNKAR